jgi:hypothetical protein
MFFYPFRLLLVFILSLNSVVGAATAQKLKGTPTNGVKKE